MAEGLDVALNLFTVCFPDKARPQVLIIDHLELTSELQQLIALFQTQVPKCKILFVNRSDNEEKFDSVNHRVIQARHIFREVREICLQQTRAAEVLDKLTTFPSSMNY